MNIKDILLIIIIIYLIISHTKKNHIENFAVTDDIRSTLKEIYKTDMESVRQLATMSQTLVGNGITGLGIVPIGSIIMWTGNRVTLPSNYKLCDGTTYNGIPTPDLRNKFIIGAIYHQNGSTLNSDSFNSNMNNNWDLRTNIEDGQLTTTGGSKDAVVVSHSHGVTDPGHVHGYNGKGGMTHPKSANGVDGWGSWYGTLGYQSTSDETTGITIKYEGESNKNKNLPPYYALAFVMRIS